MSRRGRQRILAIGQHLGERRLVRDEGPDILGMAGDQGQRVDGATAAGEEVDGSAADRLDHAVDVVGVLLGRGLGGVVVLRLRSTPRGSYVTTVRSVKWPARVPKPAAPIGDPIMTRGGSVLDSLRRTS